MNNQLLQNLAIHMERQTALFVAIQAEESCMSASIRSRDWERLEKSMRGVETLEDAVQAEEAGRIDCFNRLCAEEELPSGASFYQLAVRLPAAERDALTELYRELKRRALAARATGTAIAKHLAESRETLSGIMEELFPPSRGCIYNRSGSRAPGDLRSVVLNRSF